MVMATGDSGHHVMNKCGSLPVWAKVRRRDDGWEQSGSLAIERVVPLSLKQHRNRPIPSVAQMGWEGVPDAITLGRSPRALNFAGT